MQTGSESLMDVLSFKSYVVEEHEGKYSGEVKKRTLDDLPEDELLVKVHYSSLNYKDALSASGNKGVTKKYPHTPGVDAVGTVVHDFSGRFQEHEAVIVTGYDLGMNTPGGFGQYIRVPSSWAVRLPDGMTMQDAMIFGTAGLTAGLALLKITEALKPEDGRIAVSGASGGVGTMCIAMLAKLGYSVAAVSSKEQEREFLLTLGACEFLPRSDFDKESSSPLLKGEFSGVIDTVGGAVLSTLIRSVKPLGTVVACGNALSPKLELTVYPFILRGISLIGIDSQHCPMSVRETVWDRLAYQWKPEVFETLYREITLDEIGDTIDLMLKAKIKGRTLLNLNA